MNKSGYAAKQRKGRWSERDDSSECAHVEVLPRSLRYGRDDSKKAFQQPVKGRLGGQSRRVKVGR